MAAGHDKARGMSIDREHIAELFAVFGVVDVRRMFGGAGIYADGVMFAIADGDQLYFKADDLTRDVFEQEGQVAFSYVTKDGRRTVMSYWCIPDRLYDDPDELALWAKDALASARRAQTKTPRRRGGRKRDM
jgi:DNA transformation protein and related proteins